MGEAPDLSECPDRVPGHSRRRWCPPWEKEAPGALPSRGLPWGPRGDPVGGAACRCPLQPTSC